jgi:hypothetical protein
MRVNVLAVRPNAVKVELPPERQQGRVVWLPPSLVLDCPEVAAPAEVDGDRSGIVPGDPIPSAEPTTNDTADPADILRALALERWTERSGGGIVAVVETARVSSDGCAYFFTFTVPVLDGYRLRLFRIEHGADHYPVRITRGKAAEEVLEVSDDHSFYDTARSILDGPATAEIVRQLRSMIAERSPKSENAEIRVALPSAAAKDEDEPEDEETRVFNGTRPKRPTRLGGLAGAPQGERPSEDTLVSAGTKPLDVSDDGEDVADADDGSVVLEAQHLDGAPLSNRPDPDSDSDPDSDEL